MKISGRDLFEKITKELAMLDSAFPKYQVEGQRIDWQIIPIDEEITADDLASDAVDSVIVLIDVKNKKSISQLIDLERKKFLFLNSTPNFPHGIAPVILTMDKQVLNTQLPELPEIISDWVLSPVVMHDLVRRIFTSIRRKQFTPNEVHSGLAGELTLLPTSRELCYGGHSITLTPSELSVAELFLRQVGSVILIEDILLLFKLSGRSTDGSNIRVTLFQLRFKIEALTRCEFTLRSVYKEGYSLKQRRRYDNDPPFKSYELNQDVANYY